jgi:hypothetical protein
MAISCTPQDLAAEAKCYCFADKRLSSSVMIYLLAQLAGDTSTPAELARKSACFCISDQKSRDAVIVYLLCAIVNR